MVILATLHGFTIAGIILLSFGAGLILSIFDLLGIKSQLKRKIKSLKLKNKDFENKITELTEDYHNKRAELQKQFEYEKISATQEAAREVLKFKDSLIEEAQEQFAIDKQRRLREHEAKLQRDLQRLEEEHELKLAQLLKQEKKSQESLEDLRKQEQAAIEYRIRTYEEQNKDEFYKIQLEDEDIIEIEELMEIAPKLRNSIPLKRAIYEIYYRNAVKDLISRVTQGKRITGIYKITHIATGKCYVGQSVDIGNRWMQHCKRGAGIDKITNNKLYPAMHKYGIHAFKFEILETTREKDLNEREKYWSAYMGAKIFGFSIKS